MRGLQRISTIEELHQFVALWEKLHSIHLTSQPDQIKWRFTADGNCSSISRSAYQLQFYGSHPDFLWDKIWRLKVENKCKIFLWLILQHKLLTADRIIKRGGQDNPICQLCRTHNENASHLAANCSYSHSVWAHISQVTGLQNLLAPITDLKGWWSGLMSNSIERNQIITYTIWNIWKERCRRVYDNKAITSTQLTSLIQQGVAALRLARFSSL